MLFKFSSQGFSPINPLMSISTISLEHFTFYSADDLDHLHGHFYDYDQSKPHSSKIFPLPLQKISCGLFGISEDFLESSLCLNERFVKNKSSTYFFRAEGESMEPTIWDGDILIVDRSMEVQHKDIIVGHLFGDFICKQFTRSEGKVILQSFNPKMRPITLNEHSDFTFFGVVIGLGRDLKTPHHSHSSQEGTKRP